MLERIRLNGGHAELSINGYRYLPDDTGAFEVPQDLAKELIRVHGGEFDPGVERLEEIAARVESELAGAKNLVELKTQELKESKARIEAYKAKTAKPAESVKPQQNGQSQGNQRR